MTVDLQSLRGVPLFADLDEPAMFSLAGATEQSYPRGATVVRANEPARSVFILREGAIKEAQITPEGKEVILALHAPGDLFGELASFHGNQMTATCTTLLPSRALVVPRDDWERLIAEHPPLQRVLMQTLVRKLDDSWRLVRMLSRYTTEARLKSALLLLAERWGQPRPEGIEIALDLTHRTLADLAGASREKVTRAVGVLQHKGLVLVIKRRLVVPSLDRLLSE